MNNNFFTKHKAKLRLEAIVKSALCGLAIGFGATFVTALVTWFLPISGLWTSLAVFAAVTLASSVVIYCARFKPTDVRNARRLDGLGLYERMVTMVEYANDDSYMAQVQREDAKRVLASVSTRKIKITVSRAVAVSVVIFTVLGLGMTTVSALSDYGILPGGDEVIESLLADAHRVSYSVIYEAKTGGTIKGNSNQLILEGTDTEPVTAVPNDGYMFVRWNDGITTPTRYESGVTEDATYYAVFVALDENADGEIDYDSGDGDPYAPSKTPTGDEGDEEGDPTGEPNDILEGGGKYEPNNQVINGSTFYREVLELYKADAEDRLQDEYSDLPEELKELIEKYLGIV